MNYTFHTSKTAKTRLVDIAFYTNVIELCTLSRKLKMCETRNALSKDAAAKLELIATDFSANFHELPFYIAEAEVTYDHIKRIKVSQGIEKRIRSILHSWSVIKQQSILPPEWKQQLDQKLIALKQSHTHWSVLLTNSN